MKSIPRLVKGVFSLLAKQQSNPLYRRVIQPSLSSHSNSKSNTWFSKKKKNSNRNFLFNFEMASDPAIEEILAPFRAAVKEQVVI